MAKQSRLESEAIEARNELVAKNYYYSNATSKNVYDDQHKDAISDGDPFGKGTGDSMGYTVPGETTDRSISRKNFKTTESASSTKSIGGQYDIYGYGALAGQSGRRFLESINLYRPGDGTEYGETSVDTTVNVLNGQVIVK